MTALGLRCVACGKKMLRTVETRPIPDGVRRRKECVSCGKRITTIEQIATQSLAQSELDDAYHQAIFDCAAVLPAVLRHSGVGPSMRRDLQAALLNEFDEREARHLGSQRRAALIRRITDMTAPEAAPQ